jgi:hypothetical protein
LTPREQDVLRPPVVGRSDPEVAGALVISRAILREAWPTVARLFAKAEADLQAEAAACSPPARGHYEQAHARTQTALGDSVQAVALPAGR